MADHRSRTRAASLRPPAVFVLRLLLSCLALLAAQRAPALDAREQAYDQRLGQAFGHTALDAGVSTFLERSGQITPQQYQARVQGDRSELARLQQLLVKLPAEQQAVARQEATTTFNQGMAALRQRVTEWQQQHQPGGRPRAGTPAARAHRAPRPDVPARPYTAPQPYIPPGPAPAAWQSIHWGRVLFLLLLVGGGIGAGVLVLRRLGRAGSPALPPEPQESVSLSRALPADPAPISVTPALGPVAPPPVARVSTMPATPTTHASGDVKERLLGEQAAKYQATLTAAMDEITATQVALEERKSVPELLRKDLGRIGTLVHERVKKLMRAETASAGKAAGQALLLMPIWRRFRRGGLGLKAIIVIGAWYFVTWELRLLAAGVHFLPIGGYLALAAVCFYFERRAQTHGTVKELEANAASLQHPTLVHVYPEQAPGPMWAVRFWSASDKPACDETQLNLQNVDPATLSGAMFLSFGNLATYRIGAGAEAVLVASTPGAFMGAHGTLLQKAVEQYQEDLVPILKHAQAYGQLKWRERRQKGEIPRLEALLGNVKRLADIWAPVYVSDKVFDFIIRRVDLFNLRDRATPAGLLLHGYPGNGKEFLAQTIAKSVFAPFIKPTADQLASAKDVKAFWNAAKPPAVLFIEYADQLFPKPGSEQDNPGAREATLAFIEEWTRREVWQSSLWVVMTAQQEKNLHPRLLALLGSSKIEVTAPETIADREKLLGLACAENELPGRAPKWLIDNLGGASVRELREIVRETKVQCVPNAPRDEHWRAAVAAVRGNEGVDRTKTWDRLVLPQEIKEQLKRAARILREVDRYKGARVSVPNILLFGPPGTGKTDIARTFANEGGVRFIGATTADLKAQYVGQSAHLVRELFGRARASAPCVFFIDEIESVAAKRGSPNADSFTQEIVTEMLAQMEGATKSDRPVIILAATNLPESVDQAILDRFTSRIEIPLPDEPARAEILKRLIAERPCAEGLDVEEVAAFLAKRLNRKSGRDLVMIVNRAMERAVTESDSPEGVCLTRDLLLKEALPQAKEVSEAALAEIWSKIILKPSVKQDLLNKIRVFNRADKAAPKGLLLYGPPGTGKTEIARRIADSASCFFLSLKAPDLQAGYIGQSGERVRKVWEQARARGRCVMFIDECEGVFARRGSGNQTSFSEEIVQAFLAEWDGVGSEDQRVWVVGATNRKDLIDDAISSRFGGEVEIGLPEAAERLQILRLEMQKLERPADVPEFLGQATVGFSGRNLSRLASDVCARAAQNAGDNANGNGSTITEAYWRDAIKRLRPSEAVDAGAGWDSLILAPDTLAKLKGVCEALRHVETLRKQGITPPKGALLYGPPGTGKTQIARTLANESGLAFIAAATADLKAGFTGQSVQKVRELFDRARGRAPCILFIDEIDAIAPARGGAGSDQFTVEIVNQLLQEMDGIKQTDRHVYVLAATNRPETVDEALKSRLKDQIEIPNPDREQREQLFRLFLGKLNTDFDADAMAAELARRTNNIGGRAISAIVERAAQEAVNRAISQGMPDRVLLTREDLMREVAPRAKEVSDANLSKIWGRIVLQPAVKSDLLDKIRLFNSGDKAAPKGLLLYGPPGTGKTEIARRIADSASCFFLSLKAPDLKAGYIGQSGERVKKAWEQARARGRCVMFIDECEGVFARRGGVNTDAASEELVQAFLAEWDGVGTEGQQIWVVGATNRRDLIDEAMVSRFGAAIEIALPGASERLQILKLEMEKLERPAEIPAFVGELTSGLSGRNLSRVASDVCTLAMKQGGVITDELWREALKRQTQAKSEAVDKGAGWGSLVLSQEVLEKLQTLCASLRHVEEFTAQGFEVPKGALLYGPPGTGKTQIARALANESGIPFLAASTADMKAGFIGQSGQKVRELFEMARGRAPCILFIDEIETVAPVRGGPRADSFTGEIVTQLLQEMDGVKKSERHVFMLAATNIPDAIDEAVLSRFTERVEIPNPDTEQRARLFRLFFGKLPVAFDRDAIADELAQRSEGLGGRDIRNIIQKASQKAIHRAAGNPKAAQLSREDLLGAMPAAARRPELVWSRGEASPPA